MIVRYQLIAININSVQDNRVPNIFLLSYTYYYFLLSFILHINNMCVFRNINSLLNTNHDVHT